MGDEWKTQSQAGMADSLGWSKAQKEDMKAQEAMLARNKDVTHLLQDILQETKFTASRLSKWSAENFVLDMMNETLSEINHVLETSSIARHSDSPLEKSLASIKDSTVSFNEKTMRWHDDQTNLMVKGDDERVKAAKLVPKESALEKATEAPDDEMITKKKLGLGNLAGFLKEIASNTKEILAKTGQSISMTAEDAMESDAWQENRDKDMKKRGKTLTGIWGAMKENAKGGWLAKNWKLILAGLVLLFMPLKWFKPLWEMVKIAWNFSKDHPIIAGLLALGVYLAGPLNVMKMGIKLVGKTIGGAWKLLKGIPGFLKAIPNFLTKTLPSALGKAVGTVKKGMTKFFGKGGFLQKTLPSTLGKAVGTAKRWGRQGIEGVKSFGGTMKKGASTIVSGAKTVGGKAVEGVKAVGGAIKKGGGDWFKTLMGKFGTAGKFLAKMGKSVIQGLMTMGPYGWGIIGGIALGGLVYYFWDDITKVWDKVAGSIKKGFTAILNMVSNIVGSAKSMLGNFLRSVGAGMIADWIDPDGADKSKEAKPFTWKNFGLELWNIYTGIWGKIIDLAKSPLKAIGKIAGGFARSMGLDTIADWLEGKDEEEPKTLEGKKEKQREIIQTEKDRITRSKSGVNEYGVTADNMFGRESEGQSESQDKINTAQSALTKLIVDDQKSRKAVAEGSAGKEGKMTYANYVVSEAGVADRTETVDGKKTLVGFSKEEQLQSYEDYAGTLAPEDEIDGDFEKEETAKPVESTMSSLKKGIMSFARAKFVKKEVAKREKKYNKYQDIIDGDRSKISKRARNSARDRQRQLVRTTWKILKKGGDNGAALSEALEGTKLGKVVLGKEAKRQHSFTKTMGKAMRGGQGAIEVAQERFPNANFTAAASPDKQRETMTGIHEERAALGNQAPSPTIISSNSVETKVQSNPLAYLNASSSRGKEIVTSR